MIRFIKAHISLLSMQRHIPNPSSFLDNIVTGEWYSAIEALQK